MIEAILEAPVLLTGLYVLSVALVYGWTWVTVAVGKAIGNLVGYDAGYEIGASTYLVAFGVILLNGLLVTLIGLCILWVVG